MGKDQAALQCGVHRRWILHQVHDSAQHVEPLGPHRVGEAVPLTGDVGHLELKFRGGKPGIWSLRPENTQRDLALPWLLLLLYSATATATPARLLELVIISYGS